MDQRSRREVGGRSVWHLLVRAGAGIAVLAVGAIAWLIVGNALLPGHSAAPPTPTARVNVSSPVARVVTPTPSPHLSELIPVIVRAYTMQGRMADGKWTHVGACAVSTAQFPLGTIIFLYNADGSFNRQCLAEDTGGDIQYGQIDLAMPGDVARATRWGVRHLWARVMHRG